MIIIIKEPCKVLKLEGEKTKFRKVWKYALRKYWRNQIKFW
jgi:hypothetical protein